MSYEQEQQVAKDQLDECIKISKIIYPCYKSVFDELISPLPKSIALLYASHEMGLAKVNGKKVPHLWLKTNYPEFSVMNLTGQKGRDDEVTRFNVHPFHPYSNVWAGQQSFQEDIKLVSKYLKDSGFVSFDNLFIGDQLSLIIFPRSIGCGTTRVLLKKAFDQKFAQRPIIAISEYLKKTSTNTDSYDGSQNTDVVRLRTIWASLMPLRAHELAFDNPLSEMALKPALNRNDKVIERPKDFYDKLDFYWNQAMKKGPCCEQETQ